MPNCLKCDNAGASVKVEHFVAGRWRKARVCVPCASEPGSAGVEDGGGSLIIRSDKGKRRKKKGA